MDTWGVCFGTATAFLFLPAETWKSAWDDKSQPPKPTERRNQTWVYQKGLVYLSRPKDLVAHCGSPHLICVTCKIAAFLPKKHNQSCKIYWFQVHNCYIFKAITVPLFICLLDFFLLSVYEKKGKLINKTDETVIWESYLCEIPHICTFTMIIWYIGIFKWMSNIGSMCQFVYIISQNYRTKVDAGMNSRRGAEFFSLVKTSMCF